MKKTILFVLISLSALGQFSVTNPVDVSNGGSYPNHGQMVSDGAGGFIVVYSNDYLSPTNRNIYIQRIDNLGNKLWGINGIKATNRSFEEVSPRIVVCKNSLGERRYVVIWTTAFEYPPKIFAQSYNTQGTPQWVANGVTVSSEGWNFDVKPSPDSTKIVIGFGVFGSTTRLQVLNVSNGTNTFSGDGLLVDNNSSNWEAEELKLSYAEDDNSKVNIFWKPRYSGEIYNQRFDLNTNILVWANPLLITSESTSGGNQYNLFSLGNFIAWNDMRHRTETTYKDDIYVQRINSNGTVAFVADGKRMTDLPVGIAFPRMVKSSTGVFFSWDDTNISDSTKLYISKLNNDGSTSWGTPGLKLATNDSNTPFSPTLLADNDTLTVFYKRPIPYITAFWAQRLTPQGRKLWGNNGQLVTNEDYWIFGNYPDIVKVNDGYVLGFEGLYSSLLLKANPCASPPNMPTVNNPKLCNVGATATLIATNCAGIVNWYQSDQITKLSTGFTYIVPNVNQAISYFAECVDNTTGCASKSLAESKITILPNTANITTTYNSVNSPVTIETATSITATNLIESTGNVLYKSKTIELNNGFQAKTGSVFQAIARQCDNSGN